MPRLTKQHRVIWFDLTKEILTEIDDSNPRSVTEYTRAGLSYSNNDDLDTLNTNIDTAKVFRRRQFDNKLVNSKLELVDKEGALVDIEGVKL